MNWKFFCVVFLFASTSVFAQELKWREIPTLDFGISGSNYHEDTIYFYHAILNFNGAEIEKMDEPHFDFDEHAIPIDLFGYWHQKGEEGYDVFFTKTAYVVKKEASYFSAQKLSDPKFIQQTMPIAEVSKNDSSYHMSMGFGVPDIDFTIDFYSEQELLNTWPGLPKYFELYDGIELPAELTVIQHNYLYGRVMFQKTSKMSVSVTRYFEKNTNETLVINYTLNYIHNMPPEILGGQEFLLRKIKEGIQALIVETRAACSNEG